MPSPDATLERTQRNFILGLLLVLGLLSFLIFRPFLSYVIMGLLFVYLGIPVQRRLERWTRLPRVSALFVFLGMIVLVVGPLVWLAVEAAQTLMGFARALTVEEVEATLRTLLGRLYGLAGRAAPEPSDFARDALEDALPPVAAYLQDRLPSFITFVGRLSLGLFIFAFVLYYGLAEHARLREWLLSLSPLDARLNRDLVREISRTLDAVFLGHIVVSIVQGALGGFGFAIFGVPNAAFWGAVMIVLSLIPVIGAFLVWGPGALWLAASGNLASGAGLALWGLLVVSTADNFLRPKIVGMKADIHPVLVLVGVLGGIALFGVVGFVVGPVVLSLFVAVLNFWRRDFLPQYEAEHGGASPGPPP